MQNTPIEDTATDVLGAPVRRVRIGRATLYHGDGSLLASDAQGAMMAMEAAA